MEPITLEQYTKALNTVREAFNTLNQDFYAELDESKKTGHFRYTNKTLHFGDLKDYHEILSLGFQSLNLHQLFEALIYLYFFKELCSVSLELKSFVTFDKFDSRKFFKEIREDIRLVISLNVLEAWTRQALQAFNIKNPTDVLDEENHIKSCSKAIQYGKDKKLYNHGDVEFIVSKMEFVISDCKFDTNLAINPNIFYTSSPTQIINFTHLAKPGVYIVANVPPEAYQDAAFYIIFRQEKYAYIVENNKHSYRDQFYRTNSKGVSGEDSFLDRKYEYAYFPIQIVLDFMEKQSQSTEIINQQTLDFVSLGSLFDCCPEIVLWHYAFIDSCVQYFVKEDFSKQIASAASLDLMKPELTDTTAAPNLPAVYKASIPSLASLDFSWSAEKVGTDDRVTGTFLDKLRPSVSLDEIPVPIPKITSVEQIHREYIFNKRKKEAEIMQEALNKDFFERYEKVVQWILGVIHKKGIGFLASKAFRTYPVIKDSRLIIKGSSLTIFEPGHMERMIYSRKCLHYTEQPFRGDIKCDFCTVFKASLYYLLKFKEYSDFKAFFEIKDDSKVPEQLRTFLSGGYPITEAIQSWMTLIRWLCFTSLGGGLIYGMGHGWEKRKSVLFLLGTRPFFRSGSICANGA